MVSPSPSPSPSPGSERPLPETSSSRGSTATEDPTLESAPPPHPEDGTNDESKKKPNQLFQLVYEDLKEQADYIMSVQPPGGSLCATDLVSECYLKFERGSPRAYNDREHFVRTAARAMRQILYDRARARSRVKRGGNFKRRELDGDTLEFEDCTVDSLDLHEALSELAEFHPSMAEAVEMRVYAGATFEEIASVLGITRRKLDAEWDAIRAWLFKRVR